MPTEYSIVIPKVMGESVMSLAAAALSEVVVVGLQAASRWAGVE
jgi:hypothetical protein